MASLPLESPLESPASPSPEKTASSRSVVSSGKFQVLATISSSPSTSGKYDSRTYPSDSSSEEEMEQEFTTPTSGPVVTRFLKSPSIKKVTGTKKAPRAPRKKIDLVPETTPSAKRKMEEVTGSSPSTPAGNGAAAAAKKTKASPSVIKNGRSEIGSLTVYIKAIDGNIVKDVAFKRAKQFRQELIKAARGDVKAVEAKADSLRVVCFNAVQVDNLLKENNIMSIPVVVSRPRSLNRKPVEPKPYRGVIHNVDLELQDDEIAEETGAISVKRLTRIESGNQVRTTTVALTFKEEPPKTVNIGFYRFRVCHFIPAPIRCGRCQRFGHPTSACRSKQPRCVRCGGGHVFDDCPHKGEKQQVHCVNCGENHHAAYKRCRRYQEVRETLKIVGRKRVSYADAVKKQKQEAKNKAPTIIVPSVVPQEGPAPPSPSGSYAAAVTTPPHLGTKQANVSKPVVKQPAGENAPAALKSQVSKPEVVKPVKVIATVSTSEQAAARSTDERIDILIETTRLLLSLMFQMIKLNPQSYDQNNLMALANSVEKLSPSFTPADQSASQQPAAGQ